MFKIKSILYISLLILPIGISANFAFAVNSARDLDIFGADLPELSGNGKFVTFSSVQKLVDDTNSFVDVFVQDRSNNQITLASKTDAGDSANERSFASSISADGRYVAYYSLANLNKEDTNQFYDIYVYDQVTKTKRLITKNSDGDSWHPKISEDGKIIVFNSMASNLDGTTSSEALYLYDAESRQIEKISTGQPGSHYYSVSISADDKFIAYTQQSGNSAEVLVYNRATKVVVIASIGENGRAANAQAGFSDISKDGHYVVWSSSASNQVSGDDNNQEDIFLRDLQSHTTSRIVTSFADGGPSNYPRISADGSFVAFQSRSNFAQGHGANPTYLVYRLDLKNKIISRIGNDNGPNEHPSISDDGTQVTYVSNSGKFSGQGQINEGQNNIPSSSPTPLQTAASAFSIINLLAMVGLKPLAEYPSIFSGLGGGENLGVLYQLFYYRYLLNFLSLIGLRRKRKPWGTVYDSQTKQPLDPAIVELIDVKTGEIKERAVTDLAGRFGFIIAEGKFTVRAAKTHYAFPSQQQAGDSDEIYDQLYHGEQFDIKDTSSVFTPNIPMDPMGFDWNQAEKQRLYSSHERWQYRLQLLFAIMFWFGFATSLLNAFLSRGVWNYVMVALYAVFYALGKLLEQKRLWGRLTKKGQPIGNAILELVEIKLGVVMGKALSLTDGKFFLKCPQPGGYKLNIKPQGQQTILWEGLVEVGKDSVFNKDLEI